ncbi:MAG: redox-sensing transcriptional repressor Rex [Acidobacteria bacterium]|nr:redox-sensing transcriptional repressor Rex [Acidobacteriota bacterium]MBK8147859.1 redox-sensing transcriptional repressor Rex [Acidobacteriota bacterium]
MKVEKISELTTNRLSIYLRCLNQLSANGEKTVSSEGLAKKFHLNSAQIRKDLAYFGDFGIRGVGYNIDELREQLTKILGLDRPHALAIIGAGRLGTALADYYRFAQSNFAVAALFDSDPAKIGERIGEVSVFDIKNFPEISEEFNIDVAVIAVPAEFAQTVLQQITVSGIKAIMNFAPVPLQVPENVKLKTVDLTISLESLSYFLAQPISNGKKN